MVRVIKSPKLIEAAGNKPKIIEEFFGRVNSNNNDISIAKMKSPQGWVEPGQCPEFDEYTVVLKGCLRVETKDGTFDINEGQGVLIRKNEWVRYSSPYEKGADNCCLSTSLFAGNC